MRADLDIVLSLAGRTENPVAQPVPVRVGGFGGAAGLAEYLTEEGVAIAVDATHPYAARISANAAEASRLSGVPLVALRRPAWERAEGDRWTEVASVEAAVAALGLGPRRVFLALGRQEVGPFSAAPQHAYVVRSVEPIEPPLAVPHASYILARGPFPETEERELLEINRIDAVVSKNSGGNATYGKIAAARALGIEVVMIARPDLPKVPGAASVADMVRALDHWLAVAEKRGV